MLIIQFSFLVFLWTPRACADCATSLAGKKLFKDLAPVSALPLPVELVAALRSSSLARKYGNKAKRFFFHLKKVEILGESIQSVFVLKTLQVLFPEASFEGVTAKTLIPVHPINIGIEIYDEGDYEGNSFHYLRMPIVKAANNTQITSRKNILRDALGIPPDKLVLSLYYKVNYSKKALTGSENESLNPDFKSTINFINSIKNVDVFFVSENVSPRFQADFYGLHPSFHLALLSGLKPSVFKKYKKVVILNDLTERLPYLYKISDLTIIKGPVNFFEPLFQNSPTIIFDNTVVLEGYDVPTFNRMLEMVMKNGGAASVYSLSDLEFQVGESLKPRLPPNTPQVEIPAFESKSFNAYLKDLENYLDFYLDMNLG
jgi:hypothetical protein